MRLSPFAATGIALLGGALGLFCYGMVMIRTDPVAFGVWAQEDGVVEWLTFVVLSLSACYAFAVSASFRVRQGSSSAAILWCLAGFALVFGALEEISYGQRIFGWQSPEWFLVHNAQQETNIHNLRFYGVKLNKLIFSKGLGIAVMSYVYVFAALYRRKPAVRRFADRHGLPISRAYQIVTLLLMRLATEANTGINGRIAEGFELIAVVVFYLILSHPYNCEVIPTPEGVLRGWLDRLGGALWPSPSPVQRE